MEETKLSFYRGLPVSLLRRFGQYGCLYGLLFVPELLTITLLTPLFLHCKDAFLFGFVGYSVLLLLNSILFIRPWTKKQYMKIIVGIFFLIYIGVLASVVGWIALVCFGGSVYLFFARYYRYERAESATEMVR
jgi:hypothetical protein